MISERLPDPSIQWCRSDRNTIGCFVGYSAQGSNVFHECRESICFVSSEVSNPPEHAGARGQSRQGNHGGS